MAILLKKKLILAIWIWCLPILAIAQSIQFSDSLDLLTRSFYYDIVGLVHGNPLAIRTLPEKRFAELIQFDSSCEVRSVKPLYFLQLGNLVRSDIFPNEDSWDIVWQMRSGDQYYILTERLDESGNPTEPIFILDSLDAHDSLMKYLPEKIIASVNRRFVMSFLSWPAKEDGNLSIRTHLMDRTTGQLSMGSISIPFRNGLDRISRPFLDDQGHIYFAKYDEPLNYRLETGITVYQVPLHGDVAPYPEILIKERKPVDFAVHIEDGVLHLGALYANFYSHKIEGILHLSLNLQEGVWDTVQYHVFSEDLQKQLRKGYFGISPKEIMNSLTIQQFEYSKEAGCYALINLTHTQYKSRDPNFSRDSALFAPRQASDPLLGGYGPRRTRWARGSVQGSTAARPGGSNFLNPQDAQYASSPYSTAHYGQEPPSNPMVYKTLMAQLDHSLKEINYTLYKTVNPQESNFGAPYASIQHQELLRFSYETSQGDRITLHSINCNHCKENRRESDIRADMRHLLLLDNAYVDRSGNFMLSFFENRENNSLGLAKWQW